MVSSPNDSSGVGSTGYGHFSAHLVELSLELRHLLGADLFIEERTMPRAMFRPDWQRRTPRAVTVLRVYKVSAC